MKGVIQMYCLEAMATISSPNSTQIFVGLCTSNVLSRNWTVYFTHESYEMGHLYKNMYCCINFKNKGKGEKFDDFCYIQASI